MQNRSRFLLFSALFMHSPPADALRGLVLGAFKDAAVLAGSPWLPQRTIAGTAAAGIGAAYAAALQDALLQCARNTAHGQAGIVQPIVQLAVSLIESGGGSGGFSGPGGSKGSAAAAAAATPELGGGADGGGAPRGDADVIDDGDASKAASSAPPAQRAASLGIRLLLKLFEAHRDFRREIVGLCHDRLIGAKVL